MIENKDKKILLELLKNGRISYADLARACKMSRQGSFSRIKSLKRNGIIENFTVNLNQHKLGFNLKAYVLIAADPYKEFRVKAVEKLKTFPEISQIHELFGRFDFLVEILVKDINELTKVLSKIHELEMVNRTETMIVYETFKNNIKHPFEAELSS